MKKCKSCKKEIDKKATKCSYCKTDQRNWFRKHPILTIILVFIIFGIIGSSSGGGDSSTGSKSNITTNENSQVKEVEVMEEEDPNPHFGNGTFTVGTEIEPGTYRTRTGNSGCYYSRLSGFSGELGEIISNENTDAPAVVTIAPTDKGFKSSRCGTWTQDVSQITKSTTTFEDGIYIIGTDIEAGTYKNSDSSSCYYSRLSGFGGDLGNIISNENTDEQAIVTIAPTDKGFKSTRCGTWTLQE